MKRYTVGSDNAVTAQSDDVGYGTALVNTITDLPKAFGSDGEKELVTQKESAISTIAGMGIGFIAGDWNGHRVARQGGKALISRVTGQ